MGTDDSDYSPLLKEKLLFCIQSLSEIGEELSSPEKFESSSQAVLHLIMGTLVISKAAILLHDEEKEELRLVAGRGVENKQFTMPLPSQVLNTLHHTGAPVFVADTANEVLRAYFDENVSSIGQLHSHIWFTLRIKSRFLGVISVSRKFMGQEYERVDLELLTIIVQQLSIAINNFFLIRELRESNFQLNRKLLELETLYDLGIAIGSIMGVNELAEQILFNAVGLTDATAGLLALTEAEGGLSLASSINLPTDDPAPIADYAPLKTVLERKESIIDNSGDVEGHPYGFARLLVVPLCGQHGVLGCILLADKESREGTPDFTDDDRRLLLNFATQAGVAIENARFYAESVEKEKLERELSVAADIQRNILPEKPPAIPGMEIAATTIPSRFVGGDHYDFHTREGEFLFTIADVSGKGIPAALLVSYLHATQHAIIGDEWHLTRFVERISGAIYQSSLSNKFITYFLCHYEPETRLLTTINAGHNYPYIVSPDGSMRRLQKGGLVLGLLPKVSYEQEMTRLEPGDLLVFYTDGVTEAMNIDFDEFGEERLEAIIGSHQGKCAADVFQEILSAVRSFTAGAPQNDDITLIVCKMT